MPQITTPLTTPANPALPILQPQNAKRLGGVVLFCPDTATLNQWAADEAANVTAGTPIWATGQLVKVRTDADGVFRRWDGTSVFTQVTLSTAADLAAAIATVVPLSQKGTANGVATLDGAGLLPIAQLPPSIVSGFTYKGVWDALTNTPTIPAAAGGNAGWVYTVGVAGSTNINGITTWNVGDYLISNGTAWERRPANSPIPLVNIYPTKAAMDADLTPPSGWLGLVLNDAITNNNLTTYVKSGASGSGSWLLSSNDRISAVKAITDGLQGDVTALSSDVAAVEGDIATLGNTITSVQGSIGTVQGAMTTAQADIDRLESVIGTSGTVAEARLKLGLSDTPGAYVNRGAWATATAYALNDLVTQTGVTYVCVVAHTSGTFSTDLSAGKWQIHQGATREELAAPTGTDLVGTADGTLTKQLAYTHLVRGGKASKLDVFARTKTVRVLYGGTSIINGAAAGSRRFIQALIREYGSAQVTNQHLAALGGSYVMPYLGWNKQPFGGFGFIRLRGEASSQTLVFEQWTTKFVLRYSKETDGGSFDVNIDGVFSRTINCNGTQSYNNEEVWTFPAPGIHKIEILPPASGYAYLETLEYGLYRNGLYVMDASLGGTAIQHFTTVRLPDAPQVTGIPIVGWNGIDAVFGSTSSTYKPDVMILSWCVNDATGNFEGVYKPSLDRIVDHCRNNDIHLIYIIEMGGLYTMPVNSGYAGFKKIRDYLRGLADRPNITIIDWHGQSGLADNIDLYGPRYYAITGLNTTTGTFTGDFIHPRASGHAVLEEMLCRSFGVACTGLAGKNETEARDLIAPHTEWISAASLNGYEERLGDLPGLTLALSNAIGLSNSYRVIGYSNCLDGGPPQPLWYGANEVNTAAAINANILAAGTADEFGAYRTYAAQGFYVPAASYKGGSTTLWMTFTAVVGNGQITIATKKDDAVTNLARYVAGQEKTITPIYTNNTGRPRVVHVTVQAFRMSYLVLTGKFYAVYATPTPFACIPGRTLDQLRPLNVPMLMTGDRSADEIIVGQTYFEVVNGKTIEKVCIGREVRKVPSATWAGLYRLQNRSAVDLRIANITSVTGQAYDAKYGGELQTSSTNPPQWSMGTVTSAKAGYRYTIGGSRDAQDHGIQVHLFNPGNGDALRLQQDGSWLFNTGSNYTFGTSESNRGYPMALSLTLPDATTLGAVTWTVYVTTLGSGGAAIPKWVMCEGNSLCV
jgi:hypothetical protein